MNKLRIFAATTLFSLGLSAAAKPPSVITVTCGNGGDSPFQEAGSCIQGQVTLTGTGYNHLVRVYQDGQLFGEFTTSHGGDLSFILNFGGDLDLGLHTIDVYDLSKGGNQETFIDSIAITIIPVPL